MKIPNYDKKQNVTSKKLNDIFDEDFRLLIVLSREIASACFLYFRLFVCNNFSQAVRPRGTGP